MECRPAINTAIGIAGYLLKLVGGKDAVAWLNGHFNWLFNPSAPRENHISIIQAMMDVEVEVKQNTGDCLYRQAISSSYPIVKHAKAALSTHSTRSPCAWQTYEL